MDVDIYTTHIHRNLDCVPEFRHTQWKNVSSCLHSFILPFSSVNAAGSSGDVCDRANGSNGGMGGAAKGAADSDSPSTPKAISDLAARRARHRLLSGDTEKHTAAPSSRPLNKVIKSASATTLSLMIPSGQCISLLNTSVCHMSRILYNVDVEITVTL